MHRTAHFKPCMFNKYLLKRISELILAESDKNKHGMQSNHQTPLPLTTHTLTTQPIINYTDYKTSSVSATVVIVVTLRDK